MLKECKEIWCLKHVYFLHDKEVYPGNLFNLLKENPVNQKDINHCDRTSCFLCNTILNLNYKGSSHRRRFKSETLQRKQKYSSHIKKMALLQNKTVPKRQLNREWWWFCSSTCFIFRFTTAWVLTHANVLGTQWAPSACCHSVEVEY